MSVYVKARELAGAILASEESLRLADARALAEEDGISASELNAAIDDYNALIDEALDILFMSIGVDRGCGRRGHACKGE